MTEQQRDELLLSMKDQMEETNSKLAKHDELLLSMKDQMEETNSKLAKHDELFLSMKDQMDKMNAKLDAHDEKFKKVDVLSDAVEDLSNKFKDLSKEVRSISQSVAVIEVEHGSKIQALLDVQVGILKKLDSFESRFEFSDKTLENHSDRIWRLESEVGII